MTAGLAADEEWMLTLYVSGASPRSAEAIENVRSICDGELAGRVQLQVVDVAEQTGMVIRDEILAVPTLVKRRPEPLRRLVGNLSDLQRVRVGLGLVVPVSIGGRESGPASGP